MKSLIAEAAGPSGKGPTSLTHDRADSNLEIHTGNACAAEFIYKNARKEARGENSNPQVFVLGSGIYHRPSKNKSVEGSFVRKNKAKKGKKIEYRNINVGLGR